MKSTMKKSVLFVAIVIALSLAMLLLSVSTVALAWTKAEYAYSRQGDTVWLGEYPQTLATDKELSEGLHGELAHHCSGNCSDCNSDCGK